MPRYGMVIDLKRCIGCFSCMIACKQEHFLPPGIYWSRVLSGEKGRYPQVSRQIYPVLCNHCKEAPCVKVCPTGASQKREDGIVHVDGKKCIGCRYCVISCPYQQRTFNDGSEREYFPGQGLTKLEIIGKDLYPLEKGTVVKCNFCAERLDKGIEKGLEPGVDREATPACVITCPSKARTFGDLDDPRSKVSALIRQRKGYQLRPERGTDPSVYYID